MKNGSGGGLSRREFAAFPLAAGAALGPSEAQAQTAALPKRKWTVFVVQHSHIDIGYTERQEIIAGQHAQFMRRAVDLALSPAQSSRPPECRFKFTCEGFWQVEQFLSRANAEERRRLLQAFHQGLLELTAGYFHLSELPDQELLRRSVSWAREFARREGVPLVAAMGCDINGLSWGIADAYHEAGVRYLSMNVNPHQGAYPLGGPLTPFHWESPAGKRLLVWNGLTYCKANQFGLMGGRAPDVDPGVPGLRLSGKGGHIEVNDISLAERKLLPLLAWLETSGYRYDFLPLMGSGIHTDNSPPGDDCCRILEDWNRKYGGQVHVRTATLAEFFAHLEKNGGDLPVHRGEWTDWWSDGVATTPVDTILYRNALRNRRLLDRLDPDRKAVPEEARAEIDRKLLLYAEHTFGYSHPAHSGLIVHQVFLRKSKHAIDADELAGAALYSVLRRRGEGPFTDRRPFTYKVLNPLDSPVRSAVHLPLDTWELPLINAGFRVLDSAGRVAPHQLERRARGWNVAVLVDLAAGAECTFRLEPHASKASAPANPANPASGFENAFYRVEWKPLQGIVHLAGRDGRPYLSPARGGLGCPVYQIFPGGNRTAAGSPTQPRKRPREEVSYGTCTRIRQTASGSLYDRWEFLYEAPGANRYILEARFFHDLPYLELTAAVDKTGVRDPEGMYVYFPLSVEGGVWNLDKPGAPVRPGIDQIPESCCDYYCVQHGAALIGAQAGVTLCTLDAPLLQFGRLRLWEFSKTIEPTGPAYSWLCNNKWETNYRLSCEGFYEFRY
ncbi:MAG: hypothetical protein IT158_19620, partial [Bryobacterales bacterium]|nr:hypothetical protein [Bryobacterales bacterium]